MLNLLGQLRQRDVEVRADLYIRLVNAGILSINDVRLAEDLEPLPGDWRKYEVLRSEKNA